MSELAREGGESGVKVEERIEVEWGYGLRRGRRRRRGKGKCVFIEGTNMTVEIIETP